MAVGNAVLDIMLEPDFFPQVERIGLLLKAELKAIAGNFPNLFAKEIRGYGLMLGIQAEIPCLKIIEKLRAGGLLLSPAEDNVIRITPPLIIEEKHIHEATAIILKTCREMIL